MIWLVWAIVVLLAFDVAFFTVMLVCHVVRNWWVVHEARRVTVAAAREWEGSGL